MPDADQSAELERRVVSAARAAALLDLRIGDADRDDPAHGRSWDSTRTIRAGLLIKLLTNQGTSDTPQARAVKIRGARITGALDLEGYTLVCSLLLRDCHIDEPIMLDGATAPALHLRGCHIPGLSADQLTTAGDVTLDQGFTTNGEVRLIGARIHGQLDLSGAHLSAKGHALSADGITVDQGMFCTDRFTAEGRVSLSGATIGGQLEFTGAHLTNPGGHALYADGITVDHSMLCADGFTAVGEICLSGADIRGQLEFDGAHLTNPGGHALSAYGLSVDQSVLCRFGFIAAGEVQFSGAHIGGQLEFSGAHLTNPAGDALSANGLTVDQSMLCTDEFTTEGQIRLLGARIGVLLDFGGARLANPDGVALDLDGAHIPELSLRSAAPPEGTIDLLNARVGAFDDEEATWPREIRLRGFTYETLENTRVDVRARLRWLKLHPGGYTPQIYDQLADTYRRTGHTEAARKVGVAKQLRRRSAFDPLNWLLYATVGYGYRTWLAGAWLAGFALLGSWIFARAYPEHLVQATAKAPDFQALAYSLDVLLPIVDLGQERAWIAYDWAQTWAWFLIGAGWFLTTAAVAGLTGIFKRD